MFVGLYMSVRLCAYAPHLIRLRVTRESQPTWQVPKNVHSGPLTRECSFIGRPPTVGEAELAAAIRTAASLARKLPHL